MISNFEKDFCLLCWVIIIVTIIFVFVTGGGCSLLPTIGGDSIITTVPTATQQLWKAAKDSNWLVTVSILGIAAGAFAFLNGSKIGLPCIGASCISLFMALAVARFSTWMAVFGLIGSLAAVGISVLVKNRAVKEIVMGSQMFKRDLQFRPDTDLDIKKIFNTEQQKAQKSKSTQKLVQNVKSKLKLKGKI